MFVDKVGLPVQGVDGNANLAQCCDRATRACHRRSVEQWELFYRGGENIFLAFL